MAIGDRRELLSLSANADQIQVWTTWEEVGIHQFRGTIAPKWEMTATRVVNTTSEPATLLIVTADGTYYWYTVAPPSMEHTLNGGQRLKASAGVSISLAGG